MKDFSGEEIKEGAWIAYAGRRGSALYLTQGHVTEIEGKKIRVQRADNMRTVTLRNTRTIAVLDTPLEFY